MGNTNSIGVEFICYIHSQPIATILNLITIGLSSGKQIPEKCFEIKDAKEFVTNLPSFLQQKTTAVFLNVFNFSTPTFLNNNEFCEALKEKFLEKNIHFRFITNEAFLSTAILTTYSKIIPFSDGEIVIIIFVNDEISFNVINLIRRENGFELINSKSMTRNSCISTAELESKIFEFGIPEMIIIFNNSSTKKNILINDLKTAVKNVKIINKPFDLCISKGLIEMVNFISDNSNKQNAILPYSKRQYYVTNIRYSKVYDDQFMTVEVKDKLPVTKTCTVPRSPLPYYIAYVDPFHEISPYICSATPKVSLHHRLNLTLNIDINGFAKLNQEPIIFPQAKQLLTKLSIKFKDEKIPVIAFFDNSSIIYIWKKNCYQFFADNEWNGLYGTDLFISFLEEKLMYFEEAKEIWLERPSFVVYDLLNIMQMPPDKIITNKNWGFEVKIKNNSIVLEFDKFDVTRNQASPAYLMALLLKQHLKAIEKENGTKVEKIGFYFFDNFNAEATERVKLQLTEAATLAKVNCCFVDSDI